MTTPKPVLLSLLATLGLAASLPAADDWTGFYAGVDLGYGRHEADWTDTNYWWHGATQSLNTNGAIAGVHGGYDKQFGSLVVGGILDWAWTNFDNSEGYNNNPTEITITNTVDWVGSLRGRAGLAVDRTLLYLTYGIAFASVEHDWDAIPPYGPQHDFSGSDEVAGTVMGIGIEHLIGDRFSVRIELSETTLNDFSIQNENGADDHTMKIENHLTVVKLGGSYRF